MDEEARSTDRAHVPAIFWACIAVMLLGSTVFFFILR